MLCFLLICTYAHLIGKLLLGIQSASIHPNRWFTTVTKSTTVISNRKVGFRAVIAARSVHFSLSVSFILITFVDAEYANVNGFESVIAFQENEWFEHGKCAGIRDADDFFGHIERFFGKFSFPTAYDTIFQHFRADI